MAMVLKRTLTIVYAVVVAALIVHAVVQTVRFVRAGQEHGWSNAASLEEIGTLVLALFVAVVLGGRLYSMVKAEIREGRSCADPTVGEEDEEERDQLWVMIKTEEFFRSEIHAKIGDELTELMEGRKLGVVDGHSSGAYQFDVNFCEVREFEKARSAISAFLQQNYPQIQFVISRGYEITFDQLPPAAS